MSKFSGALVASVMAFGFAGVAHAWEPTPREPTNYQFTVTRIADVGRGPYGPVIALAESPAAACAAINALPMGGPLYNGAWLKVREGGGEMLAIALAARAQNLQVLAIIQNTAGGAGGDCVLADLRTCTDAAACALPPAP